MWFPGRLRDERPALLSNCPLSALWLETTRSLRRTAGRHTGVCDFDGMTALDEVQGLQLDHQLCIERCCLETEQQWPWLPSPRWDAQHVVSSVSSSKILLRRRTWPSACIGHFQAFCRSRSVRPTRPVSGLRMIALLRLARMAHLVKVRCTW